MLDDNRIDGEPEQFAPASPPTKIDPRALRVGKLTPDPITSAPVPVAAAPTTPTTAGSGPAKGGKGGEGGEPSLPPSNAAFLASVVRDVTDGASATICSKPGDPKSGDWAASAATDLDRQCPPDHNNYFNCSSFVTGGDGDVRARKDQFSAFHTIVLDDVGTKVDRAKLAGFTATWEVETSPGNSQVGIRLEEPIRDPAIVERLQAAIMAAELCDRGAGGLARWARLPDAINGKAEHRGADGKPFSCRLIEWNPDAAYSIDELVYGLGLALGGAAMRPVSAGVATDGKPVTEGGDDVFTPRPAENPVLTALRERDLYKHEIAPGKHDITCPWVNEHTDALDNGTAYFEPDADRAVGGFRCQHSHGDRYHVGELLDFLGIKPAQARGKARIRTVPGELNRVRRAAEKALAARGGFYQAGGAIVAIRIDPGTGDIATEVVSEPMLTAALADAADWERYDNRGAEKWVRCDPPPRAVQSLLKAQSYDFLPVLTGLARQPYYCEPSAELIATPGYNSVSGRYAAFDAAKFRLPDATKEAARAALARLEALLDEFRFASRDDKAATLCAMLTAAIRTTLPTAPAFNITAATPGSGKSYLASTIVPFAGPSAGLKVSYPTTADEASKAMLSIFLGSPSAVVFDDMQTQWLPFGAINRALTSDTITDRILGSSRTVTASTRSLVMGTGNNVGPVRDMTRRVVTIKLHHQVKTPALETYVGRPAQTVLANRAEFVSAALTMIAAYRRAGSPKASVPDIASFGDWNDMCRQPLLWLGLPDPAASIIQQLEHDPDQDDLGNLLRSWHSAVGDGPITLRDLIDASVDNDDLRDALLDLPVAERDVINRSKLGWYLRHNANRVVGGFELQDAHSSNRKAWRVVAIDQEQPAPG